MEKTDEYIEDRIPMYSMELDGESHGDLAYFTGEDHGSIIGLGGSVGHLIGAPPAYSHGINSATYRIVKAIQNEIGAKGAEEHPSDWEFGVKWVLGDAKRKKLPTENLGFMAKRLLVGRSGEGKEIILGTPLYVTKED